MVNKKVNELPVATTLSTADLFPVMQGGVTKQVTPDLLPVSTATTAAIAAQAAAAAATYLAIADIDLTAVTKADIGLSNVDNTADVNKPISTAAATALAAKADLVAGVVPSSQIPALALTNTVTVASQAAMLALTTTQVQPGDVAVRTDGAGTFILTATDPTVLGNWVRLNAPTDAVTTVNGQAGTVVLAKADVGLSNVDNTSDTNKPISTATSVALALKAPTASPTFTGTVSGITAAMVGLGNVNNTPDAAKDLLTKSNLFRVTCVGDSITYGNEDGTGISYPNLLTQALGSKVTVLNNGQGGYTSTEIAITAGAIDPTFAAATIPATVTGLTLTLVTPTGDFRAGNSGINYSWLGTLAGVQGTLVKYGGIGGSWTFTRTTAGASTTVPQGAAFHCTSNDEKRANLTIIDVGRNNQDDPTTVLSDVAAIIAHLTPTVKRYLVLGVTTQVSETTGTAGNTQVLALNTALAAAYGSQYVDIRSILMTSGLAFSDLTPTTADTTAISNGTIPPQLMYTDGLHPNQYGYRTMAKAVTDQLALLGWIGDSIAPIPKTYPANTFLDPSFESSLGVKPVNVTSNFAGTGTYVGHANAARTGLYGLRVGFTATTNVPQLIFADTLPTAEQTSKHSVSFYIRPSKSVTFTPTQQYSDAGFSYQGQDTGTSTTCPANVWTRVTLAGSFTPTVASPNLQVNLAFTTNFATTDFIDFDDVAIVSGAVPA